MTEARAMMPGSTVLRVERRPHNGRMVWVVVTLHEVERPRSRHCAKRSEYWHYIEEST